jgi:hypothetical protein
MFIIFCSLYIFCGVCVWCGLFEERYSNFELLVATVMAIIWPISLLGMTLNKFTRYLNKP